MMELLKEKNTLAWFDDAALPQGFVFLLGCSLFNKIIILANTEMVGLSKTETQIKKNTEKEDKLRI